MRPFACALVCAFVALIFISPCAAADAPRERLSLDAGWKFHLGDKWPGAGRLDKAGALVFATWECDEPGSAASD